MAIDRLMQSRESAVKLKEKVAQLPKDNSKVLKWLSYINPILLFIHSEEVTGASYIGNTVVIFTEETSDKYSRKAPNRVHEKVQTSLNLYIKRIDGYIKEINKEKNKRK